MKRTTRVSILEEQQVRYKNGKRACGVNVVWDLITSPDVTYTSILRSDDGSGSNPRTSKVGLYHLLMSLDSQMLNKHSIHV